MSTLKEQIAALMGRTSRSWADFANLIGARVDEVEATVEGIAVGSGTRVVTLTQAQYDALEVKEPATMYVVTNA